ncbi:hypothetical protein HRbin21_00461 [bacterium HR21]|nr:hypothetical protein HRbin21_00461 [bacterium HR21]
MTHTDRLQQLHQLLDGELPESQEEGLFWALASDEELRTAFRQLLLVQRILPHAQPTVPAFLEEQILQQLGRSRDVLRRVPQWLGLLLSALGGAAIATVALLLALRSPETAPLTSPLPEPTDLAMVLPKPPSSLTPSARREASLHEPGGMLSAEAPAVFPEPSPMGLGELLPSETKPVSPVSRTPQIAVPYAPPSFGAPKLSLPAASPSALAFSIRSLGAWEATTPEVSLPSRVPFGLRDLALGIVSELSPEHSVGVEIGSEAFPQEFQSRTGTLYRQRPTLLWAGLWYQWTLPVGNPRPFVRATLGGTLIGPVGKATAGILLPLGAGLHASFGVEGTVLAYTFDTRWFVTRKIGLTYGITLRP